MNLKEDFQAPEGREFTAAIADAVIGSLIRSGDLDPRGKTKHELLGELWAFVKRKPEFVFSIDHTEALLATARKFAEQSDTESSILYYAIWCEHVLNEMILSYALRAGLGEKEIEHLLKDTQFRAKYLWVHLVFQENVRKEQFHRAALIGSVRNEFVHYKWEGRSDDEDAKHTARLKGAIQAAEPLVKYLSAMASRVVRRDFKGLRKYRKRLAPKNQHPSVAKSDRRQ